MNPKNIKIRSKTLDACLNRVKNVLARKSHSVYKLAVVGPASSWSDGPFLGAKVALRQDDNALTRNIVLFQRLSHNLLWSSIAVNIRRVPGIDSPLVRMMKHLQRLGLFKHPFSPVLFTERHASQDNLGYFEARPPKIDVFHCESRWFTNAFVEAAFLKCTGQEFNNALNPPVSCPRCK